MMLAATQLTATVLAPAGLLAQEGVAAAAAGDGAIGAFLTGLTVFLLAIFLGFEVITKVPPTLHTPLMSGSNAISGITIIGAMICAGRDADAFSKTLGFFAVIFATVNVVGGFLVTNRMLLMFKKKPK